MQSCVCVLYAQRPTLACMFPCTRVPGRLSHYQQQQAGHVNLWPSKELGFFLDNRSTTTGHGKEVVVQAPQILRAFLQYNCIEPSMQPLLHPHPQVPVAASQAIHSPATVRAAHTHPACTASPVKCEAPLSTSAAQGLVLRPCVLPLPTPSVEAVRWQGTRRAECCTRV